MSQIKAGVILNYIVILLNTIVGLLYTPYMLRMLGQSEYGLYSLVASVISYLTILDLGFGNAIVRYTAKLKANCKLQEQYELFGMFFILYLIIGIIALIAGSALYLNVDSLFGKTMTVEELNKAQIMILLLVFNLAITFPFSIFGSILTAYERFIFPRIINIIRIILNTVVMIILLKHGYKAITMVIVQTIFNIFTLILNYVYCKKELKIKLYFRKFKWPLLKEVTIYSFWIFLNVIMDKIYWSTGQFILGAIIGTTAVAVFAVAIQLQHMYMQFSTAISGLFLPKITGMVTTGNNYKEISDLFIKTGRIQFIIISIILSGFIVFGKAFINLWAGSGYENAYIICVFFFVSLAIPLIQNVGITILQARNQMKFRSITYVLIAFAALFAQIILAKQWGEVGCAIAISGSLLIGQGLVMNIYYLRIQKLDILSFWKEIGKMSLIPTIITICAIAILQHISIYSWTDLITAIFIFSAIYLPLFWYFSMNKYERDVIKHPINKYYKRFSKPNN